MTTFFEGEGGIRIAGDVLGPVAGPLVILVHGGGQTRHSWRDTADRLAIHGYHVISIDLRGHGESGWAPASAYNLSLYAADLEVIIRANASNAGVTFVGASLGGMASTVAAARMEDIRINALVLVDVVPRFDSVGAARIRQFMTANLGGFATFEEVAAAVAAYKPNRPPPADSSGLMKNLRTGKDGRLYWHWDPARLRAGDAINAEEIALLEHSSGKITVPVLLVRGGRSDIVGDAGVEALRKIIPHLKVTEVPDAEHMVAGDSNAVFGDLLIDYLATVSPLRGAEES
jgi:pimeloyl-ACP methyl ester carboxylesterase